MNSPSCGSCHHHDRRDRNNRNGLCTNPESPRFEVVTGQQGCCTGWSEGSSSSTAPVQDDYAQWLATTPPGQRP